MIRTLLTVSALWLAAGVCTPALAAQSYDNCTGFIDSVPATITTQGTWCLRKDVSTALTSAYAIEVKTNNVTIDCNDFKIGGLAAGAGTTSFGVFASDKNNITVRRCNVRGFQFGVALLGVDGGGHLVENNRLDANTHTGILVEGDGVTVRHNLVRDTGGSTALLGGARGIATVGNVDVIGNTISGLSPAPNGSGDTYPVGIYGVDNEYGSIHGNRVRGLVVQGAGMAEGIKQETNGRVILRGNDVTGGALAGVAMSCTNATAVARDNVLHGFTGGALVGCADEGNMVE